MKHKSNKAKEEKSDPAFSSAVQFHSGSPKSKKETPPPPSEETILRLNAIVKETPFCFYYREKENDAL